MMNNTIIRRKGGNQDRDRIKDPIREQRGKTLQRESLLNPV